MNTKMERLITLCKRVGLIATPVSLVWWFINVNNLVAAYQRQGYRVRDKGQFLPDIYNFHKVGLSDMFDFPLLRSGLFLIGLIALVTWGVLAFINAQEDAAEITDKVES